MQRSKHCTEQNSMQHRDNDQTDAQPIRISSFIFTLLQQKKCIADRCRNARLTPQ